MLQRKKKAKSDVIVVPPPSAPRPEALPGRVLAASYEVEERNDSSRFIPEAKTRAFTLHLPQTLDYSRQLLALGVLVVAVVIVDDVDDDGSVCLFPVKVMMTLSAWRRFGVDGR